MGQNAGGAQREHRIETGMRAGKDSVSRRRQGKGLTDGADAAAWRRGSGQRAWRDKARRGQRARWVQSAAVCPPLARATSLGRRVRTTGLDPAGEPPAPPCSDTPSPHRGSGTLRGRQGKGDHGQGTGGLVPAPLVTTTLGLLRAPSPFMV